MKTVGAYEAKTHLPKLLDEVEAGASVTITKHGRPVARLVPAAPRLSDTAGVVAALRLARRGTTRGGTSVRDMISEGRRE